MVAARTERALADFTLAQRAFAVAAWPMRAAEELRSALVFRAIRTAARQIGDAPCRRWDRVFSRLVGDELRHARLCAETGVLLGAPRPQYDVGVLRARLQTLTDTRSRLLSLLLIEVAIGETLSTAFFSAGKQLAREPHTRRVLATILRDEVRHARLGWRAVAELGQGATAMLATEARKGLLGLERDLAIPALRRLEAGEPFDPALAELGVLPPEVRVETFYKTIETSIVPRLDALGLDGTLAWRDRWK